MALKYGGVVYRNLEEQVRKNMEDISELDGRIEELSGKVTGGVAVVLNGIAEATQGTLTAEQLATLQESNANYILLNNEIYLLMDKQTADGYLTYSHVGESNQKQMIKTLTITISALSWVVIEMEVGGGGELYIHYCNATSNLLSETEYAKGNARFYFISSNKNPITKVEEIEFPVYVYYGSGPLIASGFSNVDGDYIPVFNRGTNQVTLSICSFYEIKSDNVRKI